jgi:hypothetical protein
VPYQQLTDTFFELKSRIEYYFLRSIQYKLSRSESQQEPENFKEGRFSRWLAESINKMIQTNIGGLRIQIVVVLGAFQQFA